MLLLHSSLPALNTSTPYLFSQDVAHKYCNEKTVHLVDSNYASNIPLFWFDTMQTLLIRFGDWNECHLIQQGSIITHCYW